jgi:serine phosphatase RsbU (regulator of sigma subunit)
MQINRFKAGLIFRILLLSATLFAFFHFIYVEGYIITSVILVCLALVQVYALIVYTDKTNRELARFFNSIKLSDFSSTFANTNAGSSFKELNDSLLGVINQFNKTRSEKEENFQYLQTVVRHIGIGLLSFKSDGKIELINNAAKKLLGKSDLINISGLASVNGNLVEVLRRIKAGESELVKIENHSSRQVSVYAAEFKMKNELYKLVSFQDISDELERERMSNELDLAHNIQVKLLPKSSIEVSGYSVDALCIPAKEIGGDYYDFVDLGGGRYGFVIGDVAGKGMPAAIYMTLTKGIFQSFAETGSSPKEVLTKINSLIYRSIERNYFVTMLYAVLDTNKNTFTFSRAGHEPLVHYSSAEDKITALRPDGIGIGLEKGNIFNSTIKESEITLGNGDIILIHTDGITDAKNRENISFGSERILKFIEDHKTISSPELVKNFYLELNRFRNDYPQYDDMTMVVVKRIS